MVAVILIFLGVVSQTGNTRVICKFWTTKNFKNRSITDLNLRSNNSFT